MTAVFNDSGKAIATNLITGLGGTIPKYIGWGTGAGAVAAGNTTLSTERTVDLTASGGTDHTTGTPTRTTTTVSSDTVTITGTRTATGAGTVTNAGVFDAVNGGNLWGSVDGLSQLLAIGDAITFTFNTKFA